MIIKFLWVENEENECEEYSAEQGNIEEAEENIESDDEKNQENEEYAVQIGINSDDEPNKSNEQNESVIINKTNEIKSSPRNRFKSSTLKITSFSHKFLEKNKEIDKLNIKKSVKDIDKLITEPASGGTADLINCDVDDSEILIGSRDSLGNVEEVIEKKDDGEIASDNDTQSTGSEDNALLEEECVKKQLLRMDPHFQINRVIYSFKHSAYRPLVTSPREIVLYELQGSLTYVEIEEKKDDKENSSDKDETEDAEGENNDEEGLQMKESGGNEENTAEADDDGEDIEQGDGEDGVADEGEPEREMAEEETADDMICTSRKKLTNQFNFSDRGAMTYRLVYRNEYCQTEPPPSDQLNDLVCQYAIWDSYQQDYSLIEKAKEKEKQAKIIFLGIKKYDGWKRKPSSPKALVQKKLNEAIKILERMVNQNTYHELAHDYQFYDDPADKYKHEGSLLPLWEFQFDSTNGFTVTDLIWNPQHKDMFGATFGSFSFLEPVKSGYLVLYTLKNPTYPEFVASFNCGAMSLDFHPKHSKYVAVGLHDGTVRVFNLSKKHLKKDASINSSINNKHIGHVWKVIWVDDHRDKQLGFFSAGSDGRIFKWVLLKTDLIQSPVITLSMDLQEILMGQKVIPLKVCCTCVTFNPKDFEIFLVGSAEGLVYKCSISYASNYLFVYEAHNMPINQITINTFIPNIFLTSSEDWRIKMWEDSRKEPLFIFDLECSIHDIEWAPYSSSVFAAATSDGKVQVFDLNVNKHNPICVQMVIANQQINLLTRLKFNSRIHIMIVGDTRGTIQTFKVSPNLRLQVQLPKKSAYVAPRHLEIKKLEKILSFVREPMDLKSLVDARSNKENELGFN